MTTVTQTLEGVRALLQDRVAPYRYSDADLVKYLNEGLAAMYRVRPDFMVGVGWQAAPTFVLPADAATSIPQVIADFYQSALEEWIAGRAFMRDTQYGEGGVALAYTEKMRAALLTTGV